MVDISPSILFYILWQIEFVNLQRYSNGGFDVFRRFAWRCLPLCFELFLSEIWPLQASDWLYAPTDATVGFPRRFCWGYFSPMHFFNQLKKHKLGYNISLTFLISTFKKKEKQSFTLNIFVIYNKTPKSGRCWSACRKMCEWLYWGAEIRSAAGTSKRLFETAPSMS